jgi:lipopolysaccharide exporter
MQLRSKINAGIRWGVMDMVSNKFIHLVSTVIITRILMPEDFGLYGVLSAYIAFAVMFTFTGFDVALIQMDDIDSRYMNVAWTIELSKNLVLFVVTLFSSSHISKLMGMEELDILIKHIAFVFPLIGLKNVGIVLWRKNIEAKKLYFYNLAPQLITTISTVVLAFVLRDVIALVYSYLIGASVTLVLSYAFHPYRPRLDFDLRRLRILLGFGKWLFLTTIVKFLSVQGVVLFIGRVWGASTLGFYNRANAFSVNLFSHLNKLFSKVLFPAISIMKHDQEKVRKTFLSALNISSIGVAMIIALGVLFSKEFVNIILGDKWLGLEQLLIILLFIAFGEVLKSIFFQLNNALGKPRVNTISNMLIVIIMLPSLFFVLKNDSIRILLVSLLVANFSVILMLCYAAAGTLHTNIFRIIKELTPAILLLLFSLCVVIYLDMYSGLGFNIIFTGKVIIFIISIYLLHTMVQYANGESMFNSVVKILRG